jgi:hypothetical protein
MDVLGGAPSLSPYRGEAREVGRALPPPATVDLSGLGAYGVSTQRPSFTGQPAKRQKCAGCDGTGNSRVGGKEFVRGVAASCGVCAGTGETDVMDGDVVGGARSWSIRSSPR